MSTGKGCPLRGRREGAERSIKDLKRKACSLSRDTRQPALLGWRGDPRPSRTAPLGMTKTPTLRRRRRSSLIIAKNDLERHAHTVSDDAGADLRSPAGGLPFPYQGTAQPPYGVHDTSTQPSSACQGKTLTVVRRSLSGSRALSPAL